MELAERSDVRGLDGSLASARGWCESNPNSALFRGQG